MKDGWTYKRLGEVGTVISGTTPNTNNSDYWDGDICWISPAELHGERYLYDSVKKITKEAVKAKSLKELPVGTVILSSRAPIGKVAINKVPMYCNQGFKCIVCGEEIYNEFLYWWLWGNTRYLNSLGTGATFKEISKSVVENVTIPVPPLSEQQAIVSRLDSAFAKIDAVKANAEKQLNDAKTLFKKELSKAMMPKEGWERKNLGDIALDMYRGFGIRRDQVAEDGVPCVRYGEIYTTYNVSFDTCISHTKEEFISSPKYFENGDLLFAITGESVEDIGKTIAYLGNERCLLGGDIICMKHEQNPKFLAYALSTTDAIKQKGMGKTKLKVVHTNAPALKTISIPIPPLSVQQAIVSHLDILSEKLKTVEEKQKAVMTECDAMKQALLREVFE